MSSRSAPSRRSRGTASIEFALALPVLLQMLGVFDFATAFWTKSVLAGSVAQGAQYAVLTGPTASAANIKAVVGQRLAIPSANITVAGPACYCTSGQPAVAVATDCARPCPNGRSVATLVTITASIAYQAAMPLYSRIGSPRLQESATVRLQ